MSHFFLSMFPYKNTFLRLQLLHISGRVGVIEITITLHYCCFVSLCIFKALAVFARSPAAYSSLRSFRLLQLPSVSVLKQFKSSYKEAAGEKEARLMEEHHVYQKRQQEAKLGGKLVPLAK